MERNPTIAGGIFCVAKRKVYFAKYIFITFLCFRKNTYTYLTFFSYFWGKFIDVESNDFGL